MLSDSTIFAEGHGLGTSEWTVSRVMVPKSALRKREVAVLFAESSFIQADRALMP